jgi:two-component system cell cycle response regulator DivK
MANILIVEDNDLNLRLARDLLEYRGHQVSAAMSADQCRAALRGPLPDVVLMDMRLGAVSGETLLHELRADPRLAPLPVLAVTAQAMQGDRERLLAAGFDGYVAKPLDIETFGPTVESFVRPR